MKQHHIIIKIKISEARLNEAIEMLSDYYGLKASKQFIHSILKSSSNLAQEVADGYVTDTSIREQFIDAITEKLNISHWPKYADGTRYTDKFFKSLRKACKETRGLTFIEDY